MYVQCPCPPSTLQLSTSIYLSPFPGWQIYDRTTVQPVIQAVSIDLIAVLHPHTHPIHPRSTICHRLSFFVSLSLSIYIYSIIFWEKITHTLRVYMQYYGDWSFGGEDESINKLYPRHCTMLSLGGFTVSQFMNLFQPVDKYQYLSIPFRIQLGVGKRECNRILYHYPGHSLTALTTANPSLSRGEGGEKNVSQIKRSTVDNHN